MASQLSIGLSGIIAAQRALQTIGHNISNVNTEGYSRQEVALTTAQPTILQIGPIGQGVTIDQIRRFKNEILDSQLRSNTSLLGNAEIQSEALRNLEYFLNELSGTGLNNAIESFFQSVQGLSTDPEFASSRNQLLQDGINLANTFNTLDDQIKQLQFDISQQIESKVVELNSITSEIALLNTEIISIELGGQVIANDARDKREALLVRLSKFGDIRVIEKNTGSVNVILGGSLVVDGGKSEELNTFSSGARTVGVSGSNSLNSGELKGLLDIQDVTIPKYLGYLDTLAAGIIQEIDNIHSEGVGLSGGFTSLISTNAVVDSATALDSATTTTNLPFAATAGDLYVNVTDTSTGEIIKTKITLAASDTLTALDGYIDAVTNISAAITSNASGDFLTITAGSGYTFDFSKDLAFDSSDNSFGGTATATLSGYYNGSDNDTFTMDPSGNGTIGSGTLTIEVTDSGGATLAVLDVGSSYTPGDVLQIADGVSVSFSEGTVLDASTLSFDVVDDPDETNVLTALGLNTFFKGNDAATIGVTQFIKDDVSRIAAASSNSPGDNTNALRLIDLQIKLTMDSSTATFSGFLGSVVAELGIETRQKTSENESFDSLLLSLKNRLQEVSGVSIEEEMINIIRFQQAFQASAKFITVIDELTAVLMGIKR